MTEDMGHCIPAGDSMAVGGSFCYRRGKSVSLSWVTFYSGSLSIGVRFSFYPRLGILSILWVTFLWGLIMGLST